MASVPLDRITAEARKIHLGRVLLTALAALLFVLGWVAGRLVFALVCGLAAVKVGWVDGFKRTPRSG